MALQSSGAISISQIKTELSSASNSLRTLSSLANKSTPDAMSEFYGYSAATEYQFYQGDDGGFVGWEAACSDATNPLTLYSSSTSLEGGVYLYTDNTLSTPFDGGSLWYKSVSRVFEIKDGGKILSIRGC